MRDAGRKAKMRNKYTGPYQITNIASSGLYFLKDKYSHQLKRPVPPNHLVKYHGVGGFAKSDVNVEDCEYDSFEIEAGVSYESNNYSKVRQSSSTHIFKGCQRTRIHKLDKNRKFDSYPISQEQITIIQSNDRPFSSDESVIEVVSEKHYSSHNDSDDVDCDDIDNKNNPWGNMDVQEIPLNIKHDELDGMFNIQALIAAPVVAQVLLQA